MLKISGIILIVYSERSFLLCCFLRALLLFTKVWDIKYSCLTGWGPVLDGNYTRMLRAILNKSWRQHPTKHQLYSHLLPITKTIQIWRTRHAGRCWRSRDELISDVLLWTPTYGRAKAGRPARAYIQQLCEDTGCSPEHLPEAMNDREKWRQRVRDIRASGRTWWKKKTIQPLWVRVDLVVMAIEGYSTFSRDWNLYNQKQFSIMLRTSLF